MRQALEEVLKDWMVCQVITSVFGPFEILERIGPVAYRLALSPTLKVHDVFHILLHKKYLKDVDHVIDWSVL